MTKKILCVLSGNSLVLFLNTRYEALRGGLNDEWYEKKAAEIASFYLFV